MDTSQFCLGVQSLGECASYVREGFSVYNIGSAITALGVLLASYQLLNDNFKFRFNFRRKLKKFFLFLSWSSLIPVFIGSILPIFGGKAFPIIGYPLFWEILSAVTFTTGIIGLVLIATVRISHIKESDLEDFIDLIIWYIAKGEQGTKTVADQMIDFFPSLFQLLANDSQKAKDAMIIFSDTYLLHAISENPMTISSILKMYSSHIKMIQVNDIEVERLQIVNDNSFFRNLFNELLSNDNSIVARELHGKSFPLINNGLGIFSGEIFWNPEVIMGYRLLGGYSYSLVGDSSPTFHKNYLLCWSKALDSLFSPEVKVGDSKFTESIRDGFTVITSIIANQLNMDDVGKCLSWFSRFRILLGDNNARLLLAFHNEQIPDPIIDNSETVEYAYYYRPHNNTNFIDTMAFGIGDILEKIAMKIKTDQSDEHWMTRHICMEITERYENDEILNAIYDRLHIIFDQRIKKNLFGWYPMFLPLFFHAYGYQIFTEFAKDHNSINSNPFYKKIMLHVKEKLPRIADGYVWGAQEQTSEFSIEKSRKILKDILPSNMEYIRDSNTLIYYYSERESSTSIPLNSII